MEYVAMIPKYTPYQVDDFGDTYGPGNRRVPTDSMEYNALSSELPNGQHVPILDIDFPARLVRSSTRGHFHLYLDGCPPMAWRRYKRLLRALKRAGIIEPGFYRCSVMRRATFVRRPGLYKGAK